MHKISSLLFGGIENYNIFLIFPFLFLLTGNMYIFSMIGIFSYLKKKNSNKNRVFQIISPFGKQKCNHVAWLAIFCKIKNSDSFPLHSKLITIWPHHIFLSHYLPLFLHRYIYPKPHRIDFLTVIVGKLCGYYFLRLE